MVVTNFDLVPDWTDQVARHGRLRKSSPAVVERERLFQQRYLRIRTMAELAALRVRPGSRYTRDLGPGFNKQGERVEHRWQVIEGSVVVILDESHRWMNARTWSKEGRGDLLDFFSLARKRGFTVYLLAQRAENLDVQVRELFEDHILLKNLRRSMRLLGFRILPWDFFIAGWFNHAYDDECVRTDRYKLGWEKDLYDTMDTVSFDEGDVEGNWTFLPLEADEPPIAGPPPPQAVEDAEGVRSPQELRDQLAPIAALEGDPAAPVVLADPSGEQVDDSARARRRRLF